MVYCSLKGMQLLLICFSENGLLQQNIDTKYVSVMVLNQWIVVVMEGTWPDPGSNPGRRGGNPATNRLSYGTAPPQWLTTVFWRGGGLRLSPPGTSATNWPIVPAQGGRWWLVCGSRRNENWQGKPKYSEKTCPSATLSTTNPTWPDLGLNPGRRGGKPATKRLSYETATPSPFNLSFLLENQNIYPYRSYETVPLS
jgi:hypothetical protein